MRNIHLLVAIQIVVSSWSFQSASKSAKPFTLLSATTKSSTSTSRRIRISSLTEWAKQVKVRVTNNIELQNDNAAGLGWFAGASSKLPAASILLTVPATVALTVESPGSGSDDTSVNELLGNDKDEMPWYIQMAIYLHKLDHIDSRKNSQGLDMRPWLDSLPRALNTPIHWTNLKELQYEYMDQTVQRQEREWKRYYRQLSPSLSTLTWDSFLWATDMARSRAFSGAYTGSAFNPLIYAFTLLLVTIYVGMGLGTLEQAANGAGVVVCASILRDFVIPKLTKTRRYVICPMIDMTNHQSMQSQALVSFEYFENAYSLALDASSQVVPGDQVYISYGTRSNDQLLQYYGFVEVDNPHDVYVMPPLRDWDVQALESACGRTFADGRLLRLDRAGLLGGVTNVVMGRSDSTVARQRASDDEVANQAGGVVVTRMTGLDPAVLQALRALVSTEREWQDAGSAVGNFCEKVSDENEACARAAARKAMELELASKPTTLEHDLALAKHMSSRQSLDASEEDKLAVLFRIEKKKVLINAIERL
ncbi:hypothetical protein MPSEU_000475200 [Mayamaea pseudoterrestris]|nr:hypothetical protein MPSEU_000475200 [Mayamaea pseudoterrestris]